jgi:radical SAM-linked protein
MAPESVQAALPAEKGTAPPSRPKHKIRLRFRKAGNLRLVSHIDLLHVFERMLRRAALPFARTQGFHPKPCLVFAHALALGVAGLDEVVELELDEPIPADEVMDRLNPQAPPGLEFLQARAAEARGAPQVRRASYRVALPAPDEDLPRRCAALLARPRCIVERAKPRLRRIDIRPYLCDVHADAGTLTMSLWITPYGAARPEEIVKALGLGDLLEDGAVLERIHLELMDELPEHERWLPEIPRLADADVAAEEVVVPASATREHAAPSADPLIANPLSFET